MILIELEQGSEPAWTIHEEGQMYVWGVMWSLVYLCHFCIVHPLGKHLMFSQHRTDVF